jgi:hypothetical protein
MMDVSWRMPIETGRYLAYPTESGQSVIVVIVITIPHPEAHTILNHLFRVGLEFETHTKDARLDKWIPKTIQRANNICSLGTVL